MTMAKSSKNVSIDIFYVFIGHKHLRGVRQCLLAVCGCSVWTVSDDTYLEVMRPPAQPPTHQPLPTHPPPSLNLTPPHSFGRFKSKDYQNIYFISFSTFQENKLYHFFFRVMMIKAILMKWPPPETEIMRMQARSQVKAEPRCNSRTPDTWTRGGGAAAHCWPQPRTTSAGHCHGDTVSGGPSAAFLCLIRL